MPSFVIVGASRGLGYAWLEYLSKDSNNTVIGLVRTPVVTEKRLAEDNITNVHILHGDMADYKSLNAAAASAAPVLPDGLDVIIVNGFYGEDTTLKIAPSGFASNPELFAKNLHASLDINVIGVVHSINAFLPLILKGVVKKIIVISTGHADLEVPLLADIPTVFNYSVTKAAVNMVVAKFAAELRPQGVKVLALSPGLVATSNNIPSEEDLPALLKMIASFKKVYPNWKGTPITPAESVEYQLNVINALTMEKTGQFLSHWGNKAWL